MTTPVPTGPIPSGPADTGPAVAGRTVAGAAAECLLPGPRDPLEAARQALARALQRGAAPMDEVRFSAACPACGRDCQWRQIRIETRLINEIGCDCEPGTRAVRAAVAAAAGAAG